MDQPITLNQERPYKIESYSNSKAQNTNILEEPVTETIKRDLKIIAQKIKTTLTGQGDYQKLRRQWDLWGPLIISLVTGGVAALCAHNDTEDVFVTIFVGLWVGPLVIALNAKFLGAKHLIIPSACLMIYCSAPLMLEALAVWTLHMIGLDFFIIQLLIAALAVSLTMRFNYTYFTGLVPPGKVLLNLYPVLLFYVTVGLFIAML